MDNKKLGDYESDEDFIIERIVDDKKVNGKVYYLVKWQGYSGQDTWELKEDLEYDRCHNDIEKYERQKRMLKELEIDANESLAKPASSPMPVPTDGLIIVNEVLRTPNPHRRSPVSSKKKSKNVRSKSPGVNQSPAKQSVKSLDFDADGNSADKVRSVKKQYNLNSSKKAVSVDNQIANEKSKTTYLVSSEPVRTASRQSFGLFKDDVIALSVIVYFSISALFTLGLDSISQKTPQVPVYFKLLQLIVNCGPLLVCFYTVFYKVPSSSYSNRVSASILWMMVCVIYETIDRTKLLSFGNESSGNGDESSRIFTLISLFFVHFMLALAVRTDYIPTNNMVLLSGLFINASSMIFFPKSIKLINGEGTISLSDSSWILQFMISTLCIYSWVRVISRIMNHNEAYIMRKDSFPEWLDLLSIAIQTMVSVITLLQEDKIINLGIPERFVIPNWPIGEVLEVNGIWMIKSGMRWIVVLSLCLSSMLRVQAALVPTNFQKY